MWRREFYSLLRACVAVWEATPENDKPAEKLKRQHVLSAVTRRVRANIELLTEAVKQHDASVKLHLPDVFLALSDLSKACMCSANLEQAQLQKSQLQDTHLEEAKLREAVLDGATLMGTRLQGADLYGASLNGATLAGTKLQGADLRCAQLQGALLTNVRLDGAKLFYMQIDEETHMVVTDPSQKEVTVNWWAADFSADNGQIDEKLLEELYRRFGHGVPEDLNEVHPSARKFIAGKRRQEHAGQALQEPQPPSDGEASG